MGYSDNNNNNNTNNSTTRTKKKFNANKQKIKTLDQTYSHTPRYRINKYKIEKISQPERISIIIIIVIIIKTRPADVCVIKRCISNKKKVLFQSLTNILYTLLIFIRTYCCIGQCFRPKFNQTFFQGIFTKFLIFYYFIVH